MEGHLTTWWNRLSILEERFESLQIVEENGQLRCYSCSASSQARTCPANRCFLYIIPLIWYNMSVMEAKRTETQPTSSMEQFPTESRIGRRQTEETRAKLSAGKKLSEEHRAKISEANKGKKRSEETRAKISAANKGRRHTEETRAKISAANKGKNNPNYGKKPSEETRAKMSEALKGRKLSEEHRARISESLKGRRHTEEARTKMSKATSGENHPMYGKKLSEEHRAKISEANKGKKPSEETRAKIGEASKGRKHTAETRAKISENRPNRDKSIKQVRQAIALHAGGMPMSQASLRMGFNNTWLGVWKRNHPERFRAFYFEEVEKNDRKMIRQAVGAYALGASMEEASQHVGMPEEWFRGWQDENLREVRNLAQAHQ